MINREKLVFNIGILRHFINNSLDMNESKNKVSGFELSTSLLDSAAYNTYIETICTKSDTIYLQIKKALSEMTTYSYLDYINRLSSKFDWKNKLFILAFDYTDEEFYGEVQGFDIHGAPKNEKYNGKFKFLTCSVISDDIPEKIPLISVPIKIGHNKAHTILYCLSLIKQYIGNIELIIFDRGYYDKNLMYELGQNNYPYLIFVPKANDKKELLFHLEKGEQTAVYWSYELNRDKTKYKFDSILVLLKNILHKKTGNEYDWVFVTNVQEVALGKIIRCYKKRWRIETGFRVQDEARIKCKSKEMKIRYFFFMFQQLLQTQWMCFFKEEVSFKRFLVEMHKTCGNLVENPNKKFRQTQKH